MSMRYFRTRDGGTQQVGNLTEEGAAVLLNTGHEEITAEEYQAEEARQAEAVAAPLQPAAAEPGGEQPGVDA